METCVQFAVVPIDVTTARLPAMFSIVAIEVRIPTMDFISLFKCQHGVLKSVHVEEEIIEFV